MIDDTNTASGWDNNGCAWAEIYGAEDMTDLSTPVRPYATANWIRKSDQTPGSDPRPWSLIGDGRLFYIITRSSGDPGSCAVFGDIISNRPGDAYHCVVIGHNQTYANNCSSYFCTLTATGYKTLARAHHQQPGDVSLTMQGHGLTDYLGYEGLPFPKPVRQRPLYPGTDRGHRGKRGAARDYARTLAAAAYDAAV